MVAAVVATVACVSDWPVVRSRWVTLGQSTGGHTVSHCYTTTGQYTMDRDHCQIRADKNESIACICGPVLRAK